MKSKDFDQVKPYVYWIKNKITGIKYIEKKKELLFNDE